MAELSAEEILRYSRQLVLPEVTVAGQQQLKAARVLCVGAGGLGSPLLMYLAAAGIGCLGLVDFDVVDLSNIQRQVLYASADVGRLKLDAAAERIRQLNPHTEVVSHCVRLDQDNVMAIVADYDILVDGSDNFVTRYLLSDAGVIGSKPVVHASVFRFEGQLTVFNLNGGPCYRCLFPEPPPAELVPSCAEGGVLGMLPGIMGSLQALEVVKLVLGRGQALQGRLLLFDGLRGSFRELPVSRDPDCRACGSEASLSRPIGPTANSESPCVDPTATEQAVPAISVEDFAAARRRADAPQLIDVRDPPEYSIASIDGALLLPLAELPTGMAALDPARAYVLTCHHGGRSRQAYALLLAAGFSDIQVLEGGIDAWSERIDSTVLRY